jgi:hypothetical protein
MLEVGRRRVSFLIMLLDRFLFTNPSSHTMAPGLTQTLTEMSSRNHPGVQRVAGTFVNVVQQTKTSAKD